MKKICLVLLIALISTITTNANHLIGGELFYRCEGSTAYEITLSIYRDCNCTQCAEYDDPAIISIFEGNNFLRAEELDIKGRKKIKPNIADLCIEEIPNICVERSLGYEKIITLPSSEIGYKIVYQRCCRNNTISNIPNPGETGSTYEVSIPPDSLATCNNSAVFNNYPPTVMCVGYPFEFDHAATDLDGDSLVYELCTPFSGASPREPQPHQASDPPYEPIIWSDGFSAENPLFSNTTFSLDASTGQLSGLPIAIGQFVVAVCVKEFRNGALLNTSVRDFQFNVTDCSIAEFSSTCIRTNKIQTHVYYDVNQNKIKEAEELWVNNLTLRIDPLGILGFPNQLNEGIFYVNPGAYTVSYEAAENTNWFLTTDTASYSFNILENETKNIEFGVYPKVYISNVKSIIAAPPTRCNDTIAFDVVAKNIGTTITNGILWFNNDSITKPIFADEPDTIILPQTFGWFFSDLQPSHQINKQIYLSIPGPELVELGDTSFFQLSEQVQVNSRVNYTDVNGTHQTDNFEYREIRCSFDPNDKLVHPSRPGNYTLFEEELTYTIRFQNTGNDEAYNILIKDTIDRNLDVATMEVISSSHSDKLNTRLSDALVYSFHFVNINLPDSASNPAGSQGYITYSIKPKPGLAENTIIKNSAAIFFDLNPHIQTNTVESKMVSEFPVVSVEAHQTLPGFLIEPNPTTGLFNIKGITNSNYIIYNVGGQPIQSGHIQSNGLLDISSLTKGMYFMRIEKDGKVAVERIVKI